MELEEKLAIARALSTDLHTDVIEAGFPISSPEDFDAVQEIAKQIRGSTICGLARCREEDISKAWEALKTAQDPRIHVFLATSGVHREFKLRMSKKQIIEHAVAGVRQAVQLMRDNGKNPNIEFSPEDAVRTERPFLRDVVQAVIDSGATTVNIPDTVGYATPQEMQSVVRYLLHNVTGIDRAVLSVHCHNDLGMATANSLAAVEAGAGQVECTINGIGERAGNAAFEQVVMGIHVRGKKLNARTAVETEKIMNACRLVSGIVGQPILRTQPITGRNTHTHGSGIHAHGTRRHKGTYEIFEPELVGAEPTSYPLIKHCGSDSVAAQVKALGFETPKDLPALTQAVKHMAQNREICPEREVDNEVLLELLADHVMPETGKFISSFKPQRKQSGCKVVRVETAQGRVKGIAESKSEGAINAFVTGLNEVWKKQFGEIVEVEEPGIVVHSKQGKPGSTTAAVTSIRLRSNGMAVTGRGEDTDNEIAGLKAVENAANRLWALRSYQRNLRTTGNEDENV